MSLPPAHTATVTMPTWVTASNTYYGYCTLADVRELFLNANNMSQSVASDSVVAQCITMTALEMQTALELVYQMPYAGSDLVILGELNEFNAKLAAAEVLKRVYTGASPDQSAWGAILRQEVMIRLKSIIDGEEQWASPFHDAVAQSEHAAYPRSALVQVEPNTADDSTSARPMFSRQRSMFTREDVM